MAHENTGRMGARRACKEQRKERREDSGREGDAQARMAQAGGRGVHGRRQAQAGGDGGCSAGTGAGAATRLS